jgi:hypothetical protein
MASRKKAPDETSEERARRTVEELQRDIGAALERASSVLSTGILGKLLADLIEQHKKKTGPE